MNGGIIMSVPTALSIEKMVNIQESFAMHAKRKFPYGGKLHVGRKKMNVDNQLNHPLRARGALSMSIIYRRPAEPSCGGI